MSVKRPDPVDIEVGHRIRIERLARGLSQTALANQLGVTFQQVQKYEKGSNRVSASRLYYVAQVLGVPIQFFFDELRPASPPPEFGEAPVAMTDLLVSSEVSQLARTFSEISDPVVRRAIIGLARHFVEAKR